MDDLQNLKKRLQKDTQMLQVFKQELLQHKAYIQLMELSEKGGINDFQYKNPGCQGEDI